MKLPVEVLERAEKVYNPGPDEIHKIRERIKKEPALKLDGAEHLERRKAMIASVATEDVLDAQERYVGDNDLLPINYLLTGHLQSRSVGRVRYFDLKEGKVAYATGFLITEDLMLTNYHVFPTTDAAGFKAFAEDAVLEFNHEFDIDGQRETPVVFQLDPEKCLVTDEALDMAIVGIAPKDVTGRHAVKDQGYLVLNGGLGKAGTGDWATIIQHPEGKEKQIALRNNQIINRDLPNVLIYVTDTARGSSGGCVFNNEWQVIALHSTGVAKKNAKGKYVDKNDQVIEPVNGKIDGDRVVWTSNSGIRVSSIMEHLRPIAHPLVQALFSPAYTDSRPYMSLSRPALEVERAVALVPAPAPLALPQQPLSIQISFGGSTMPVIAMNGAAPVAAAVLETFEKKYEDELDFSGCAGFDEDFMGVRIPMPLPSAALRRKLAFHLESPNTYLLKYHHFTSFQHAMRRVPVVSAINVDAKHRYAELDEEGSRKDKWIRDNRIDYDVQLNDDFYAKSGFDKGHLCRREDAEWGTTVTKAKLAADLTCSYVNAVPQVPALNRDRYGYHGLWGQLEEKLLEQGIELEAGKSSKICVFNGPLFKDDDPIFKGVQVALDFFKVVVWYDATGALRTTCFTLTQEDLVGEIAFEALRFDKVFTNHQIAIKDIEKATGLEFHKNITDNDTYTGAAGGDELTDERFERFLKKMAPARAGARKS